MREIWCSWDEPHVASGTCFSNNHLYGKSVTKCSFLDDGNGENNNDYYNEGGATSGGGNGINNGSGDPNDNDPNQLYTIPVNCKWDCPDEFDDEIVEDDDQIFNELTGKAECLNGKLNKKGNSFVKGILNKFKGDSKFDINIKSKDKVFKGTTNIELNGKTRHTPGSSLINIEISTSKLSNMPALAAARTLIHEYIHADMFRKINTTNYDGDLDFKTTYEKFEKSNFKPTPQHNTMGELYVHSIRDALKNFHKNVLTSDYNKFINYFGFPPTDIFYEALAWQGLKGNNKNIPPVQAYTNLSAPKKTALTNTLSMYLGKLTKNCPK